MRGARGAVRAAIVCPRRKRSLSDSFAPPEMPMSGPLRKLGTVEL